MNASERIDKKSNMGPGPGLNNGVTPSRKQASQEDELKIQPAMDDDEFW